MGTRSRIGIYENGAVKSIYCHWDGYIEHNGEILFKHYDTTDKVEELIMLGDLSCLDTSIGVKTDFNAPEPNQCIAYHRDRGEELNIRASDEESMKNWEEYNYLFKNGVWLVSCSLTNYEFEPLKLYVSEE